MKHSEKDKLEQFFQNSLENYGENPSADFWSEMENKIPPPPASATSFWKKYGLGLVLLLAIGLLSFIGFQKWNHDETIANINKTIELKDAAINEMSKELEDVQNRFSTNKTIENQKVLELDAAKEISQQYIYNVEKKENKPIFSTQSNLSFLSDENNNAIDNTITNSNSDLSTLKTLDLFSKNEIDSTVNSSSFLSSISEVEKISSPFLEVEFSKKKILEMPKEEVIVLPKMGNERKGFEIFGGFHQIYPTLKIQDISLEFESPTNQESNFGLMYSFTMNKRWAVQFGLGFGNSTHSIAIKNDFEYANSEFEISDNITRTRYDFNIETNYNGFLGFQSFVYNYRQNDGQDIYAGDSFTAEITSTKRQKYLMFPMYLKYYLSTKSKRLKWAIKMGIIQRFGYFENEIALVNFTNFSHPRLEFSHTNIISISENQKRKYKTELVFGTGVEYNLSKNWTLILEPTFKQSTTLEGKITPHTFGIYTGVRWNFL